MWQAPALGTGNYVQGSENRRAAGARHAEPLLREALTDG